jgi:hypothetical protein
MLVDQSRNEETISRVLRRMHQILPFFPLFNSDNRTKITSQERPSSWCKSHSGRVGDHILGPRGSHFTVAEKKRAQ